MKKGISLIVLVITIIVMIIIAGAIILSLNSSNVITKANEAVAGSDLANARNAAMLAYAEAAAGHDGVAMTLKEGTTDEYEVVGVDYYTNYLTNAKFDVSKYTITVDSVGLPKVEAKTATTPTGNGQ